MYTNFSRSELINLARILINRMETEDLTNKEFDEIDKKIDQIFSKLKELQDEPN